MLGGRQLSSAAETLTREEESSDHWEQFIDNPYNNMDETDK